MIRAITRDGPPLIGLDRADVVVASRLSRLEVARTLNRLRIELRLSSEDVAIAERAFATLALRIEWLRLSEEVLDLAAQPTALHLKSLYAIQLATARTVRDTLSPDLVFATHDRRLATAAASVGFEVAGV